MLFNCNTNGISPIDKDITSTFKYRKGLLFKCLIHLLYIYKISYFDYIVGYKTVFQPNVNRATCRKTRYQPFIFKTANNSDCIFQKYLCNSEGQTTYENGNTTSDRKCICNIGKGYTFVGNQKNQCFCDPSTEDCSCYIDINKNNIKTNLTGEVT